MVSPLSPLSALHLLGWTGVTTARVCILTSSYWFSFWLAASLVVFGTLGLMQSLTAINRPIALHSVPRGGCAGDGLKGGIFEGFKPKSQHQIEFLFPKNPLFNISHGLCPAFAWYGHACRCQVTGLYCSIFYASCWLVATTGALAMGGFHYVQPNVCSSCCDGGWTRPCLLVPVVREFWDVS